MSQQGKITWAKLRNSQTQDYADYQEAGASASCDLQSNSISWE